jgi:hypothetical protein
VNLLLERLLAFELPTFEQKLYRGREEKELPNQ